MCVDVKDEIGDEVLSVVCFNIYVVSWWGYSYDVEYVLFVKMWNGLVCEVVEFLDIFVLIE